ncbi:unnamed protein product [Phaedon cochleariae]|uniref:Reverse transcriptase n=1 Tax=Phaedon cochleariae TaxID=80249 RepID=A0A9N9SMV3_PHACE|nr:unnamed protein product [Phaedon cochleariae]
MQNPDPAMQAPALGTRLEGRLKRLARATRINWPVTDQDLESYVKQKRRAELARWSSQSSQGKSVTAFTDNTTANAWLSNPTILKPGRMITALRMRTNSCSNRVAMNRIGPVPDIDCRQCGTQLETLGHILGMCRYTKPSRIRRHDEICDLIVQEVQKQGREEAVTVEPPTMVAPRGGNLKPDLVIQRQGRVLVVDVTVRHEDGNNLAMGHNDKMRKYGKLLPQFRQRFGSTDAKVLPIVVGTRGAMPRKTIQGLQKLGITTKGVYKTISLIVLRSSIEIYHDFMEYNAPLRRDARQPP